LKLFVGNLGFNTESATVEAAFANYGEVTSVAIITDQYTGRSRGFGFVEMPDQAQAEAAIQGLNGSMMDGRPLTVNEARAREDNRSGDRRPAGNSNRDSRRW
jgi:RNA recognition motif-containing protein